MVFDAERRDSLRLKVDPAEVRIQKPDALVGATVVDLSATGGGLLVPSHLVDDLDDFEIHLELGEKLAFDARAKIARREPVQGEQQLLGLSFENLEEDSLGVLSQFLMSSLATSSDARSIQKLLRSPYVGASEKKKIQGIVQHYLFRLGNSIRVFKDDRQIEVLLRARGYEERDGKVLLGLRVLQGSGSTLVVGESLLFLFAGNSALNFFRSSVVSATDIDVWIESPARIQQAGFRRSSRTKVPVSHVVNIEIVHPRLAGKTIIKPVFELGAYGLSFAFDPKTDALFPGEHLPKVKIDLPDSQVMASAYIRSVRADRSKSKLVCGIELEEFASQKDMEAWEDFVISNEYPTSHVGKSKDVDDLWAVLESSGYLQEYVAEMREHLEREFFHSWKAHADNTWLGRFVLLKKNDRPVGTIATSLVYPATWMVHHFGIDRHARMDKLGLFSLARDAYCSLGRLFLLMSEVDNWIVFFDSRSGWDDWVCTKFVENYPDKDDFVLDDYSLFRWTQGHGLQAPDCRDIKIVKDKLVYDEMLSNRLARICPPLEMEAYAYQKPEISLSQFQKRCAQNGYERSRTIFHAVQSSRPVASLIAETGEEGVNIFGLLNSCRIVPLESQIHDRQRVYECLLYRAIEFYQARGKREFLFSGDEKMIHESFFKSLGYRFVAKGIRLISRKKLVPVYMTYLDELLGILHG